MITNKTRENGNGGQHSKKTIFSAFLEKMLYRTYQNWFDTQKATLTKGKPIILKLAQKK